MLVCDGDIGVSSSGMCVLCVGESRTIREESRVIATARHDATLVMIWQSAKQATGQSQGTCERGVVEQFVQQPVTL